ncbi:hypothetical protein [Pontivivens nitratireducens]|uniref:Uncharacterized protein n=1 Tax=Pontivivens nitratireducens TaxID=2758038 RepID=A0A6G7VJP8_9RHOB|nr:hypothetical protein [Pontibrevibacter nitratireducens]QIK40323.1 hypothetical protein G8E03_05810 [Pontibrevibacter nitratireducens]
MFSIQILRGPVLRFFTLFLTLSMLTACTSAGIGVGPGGVNLNLGGSVGGVGLGASVPVK